MVIENQIPKTETVCELKDKYEIPSFEEFMKTYESDDNLNYDDLRGGGIGEVKGYGPCSSCSGSNRNVKFEIEIVLKNCMGGWKSMKVYNTDDARREADKIKAETGHWEDEFLNFFSQEDRKELVIRIKQFVEFHKDGEIINASICNKGNTTVLNYP